MLNKEVKTMEEKLAKIKQIVMDTDRDMDRLPSKWCSLRIDAYEKIREVLGYPDYIPAEKEDA
jgi:hypothetical protein